MGCQRCGSERIFKVSGKCADMFTMDGVNDHGQTVFHDGYVPDDAGIGGGDYVRFSYCLDCGQIQRKFPLKKTEIEREEVKDQ